MKRKFKFDDYEIRILILALNELRNQLIREERYTDAVDELLIKLFVAVYYSLLSFHSVYSMRLCILTCCFPAFFAVRRY